MDIVICKYLDFHSFPWIYLKYTQVVELPYDTHDFGCLQN